MTGAGNAVLYEGRPWGGGMGSPQRKSRRIYRQRPRDEPPCQSKAGIARKPDAATGRRGSIELLGSGASGLLRRQLFPEETQRTFPRQIRRLLVVRVPSVTLEKPVTCARVAIEGDRSAGCT